MQDCRGENLARHSSWRFQLLAITYHQEGPVSLAREFEGRRRLYSPREQDVVLHEWLVEKVPADFLPEYPEYPEYPRPRGLSRLGREVWPGLGVSN